MMKAYWIQVAEKKVTEVQMKSLAEMSRMVGGSPALAHRFDNLDAVFVDNEACLKNPGYFFLLRGGQQVFAGNGIVVGKSISPTAKTARNPQTPLPEVTSLVCFCDLLQIHHVPGYA